MELTTIALGVIVVAIIAGGAYYILYLNNPTHSIALSAYIQQKVLGTNVLTPTVAATNYSLTFINNTPVSSGKTSLTPPTILAGFKDGQNLILKIGGNYMTSYPLLNGTAPVQTIIISVNKSNAQTITENICLSGC